MKLLPTTPLRRTPKHRASPRRDRQIGVESLEDRCLLTIVSLTPSKDNSLFETSAGTVSNGAGNSIMVGRDHFDGLNMRGLMAFDVASKVPAGSTINSVTLSVWVNTTFAATKPSVELHKLLADWGEAGSTPSGFMPPFGPAQNGDATWLHTFYPNQTWVTPGGDFSSTVSGAKVLGPAAGAFTWSSTAQMVADVQAWLNNPAANFGWLLKGDETQESGKMIDSRESTTAAHRPTLTIDYTAPPPVPNLAIGDVTIVEGNSGTTNAQFAVTLSAASTNTVTVNYATANVSATAGSDYVAASGTLTFAPGETTKNVTIPISGDTIVEQNETFQVNLSGVSNANISDGQATGTITNDDSASLAINDVTAAEGNSGTSNLTFTVTLNAAVDVPVSIGFSTADGTMTVADGDYTAGSGTLNFAGTAGETKTVTIQVSGDQKVELDENMLVNLANLSAGGRNVTIADNQGRGTISNDDTATLAIDDVTKSEGNAGTTTFTFTVTLNAAVDTSVGVGFATADSTATLADNDYVSTSDTLNFAGTAGETKTIAVQVNGDTNGEPDESFLVDLANLTAAGRSVTISDARGVGTILNDDGPPLPTLVISDVNLAESNSGVTAAQFDVTLSAPNTDTVTVDYSTADGTAVAGQDFQTTNGTLTFAPGETMKSITVPVNGDGVVELTESFSVNLSNAVNARISDAQGAGTITNDDAAKFSINDVTLAEGNSGTTSFTFKVVLDAAVDAPLSVAFATADGSATAADGDFASASGTLNFGGSAGETKTVTIQVNGDTKTELDETLLVNLSNIGAAGRNVTLADGEGLGTITNDDPATISISDATRAEGNSGTSAVQFNVTLSGPTVQPVTVNFATSDGTAAVGTDYQAASGMLTFAPGETTKVITVNVTGDQTVELNEDFMLNLSNPTNATIADGDGQGTITNDDAATFTINDVTMAEGNSGTTDFTFTVTLSAGVDVPVTVDFATADGSATVSGSDFTANSGTLQFGGSAGETHTIIVSVNGDTVSESAETFSVKLSNPSAGGRALTISDIQGTGTISNDDVALGSVEIRDAILHIVGTDQGDRVQIRRSPHGMLEVSASFLDGSKRQRFKSSDVSRIDMRLNGGDDFAEVSRGINTPATIDGGAGNDSLHGGSGNDMLLGSSGQDQLFAGAGHNLLIGGSDSDQLFGNLTGMHRPPDSRRARQLAARSDTILIGGQTTYDANDAALEAIMAEWTSVRPYSDRVNNISAGVGPNATFKLSRGDTVLDDLASDIVNAGSATGWALTFPSDKMVGRGDRGSSSSQSNGPRLESESLGHDQ